MRGLIIVIAFVRIKKKGRKEGRKKELDTRQRLSAIPAVINERDVNSHGYLNPSELDILITAPVGGPLIEGRSKITGILKIYAGGRGRAHKKRASYVKTNAIITNTFALALIDISQLTDDLGR